VRVEASAALRDGADVPQARLRLALVEDEVGYPGGNGLETHHRVVRGFLGGVEGMALEDGTARIETTCVLGELRSGLDAYLDAYPQQKETRGEFPRERPAIALERLSVVGIVQGDAGKEVLHAVIVPVEAATR
jgi:hypothetical protein